MKTLAEIEKLQRNNWGLRDISFPDVPPDDPALVSRFFVGRDNEYARLRNRLYRGENVLVRGTWGIGKTALILATLYRLQQEVEGQTTSIRPTYIKEFRGGQASELYAVVHMGLRASAQKSAWFWLKWLLPSQVGVKIIAVEAKWEPKRPEALILQELESILNRAKQRNCRLVVAIDDLDKTALQQGSIITMLKDSLNFLRDARCSFVLTGRAITQLDDLEISQLGVVSDIIELKPLNGEDLRQAAIRQLNLVRFKSRDDAFPFHDQVIKEIAKKSVGIPRVFYRLCKKTLDIAAMHGYKVIDISAFNVCYQAFQNDLGVIIPPDVKRILYYALQRNGLEVSSKDETLEEVLPLFGAASVYDLLPHLDRLVRQDYMMRVERPEGIKYEISPGTEHAAEDGKNLI